MYGDEFIVIMVLFDIFNFLVVDDVFNEMRDRLFKELKIVFIFMLNLDGVECF